MSELDRKLMQTPDLNKERLETLKSLFPDLFTVEGKLNPDELKKIVDPDLVKETERFEFKWFGKSEAKRNAFSPGKATLVYDAERSVNPEYADGNMIIEGENLETLKCLLSAYRERFDLIYIDPPYNTGKDFVYSDKWAENTESYWEHIGVSNAGIKLDTNAESSGKYHSNWLNFMYPRLLLARQCLKKQGVIFISIDDNEYSHLIKVCDEIFGEENFTGAIIWQTATDNNATQIATEHEYIVCYCRDISEHGAWEIPSTTAQLIRNKYNELLFLIGNNYEHIQTELRKWIRTQNKNGDDLSGISHYSYVDEKGVFYPGNSSNTKPGGYTYDILHPVTKKVCSKPENGYRFKQDTFWDADKNGDVLWGDDEKSVPKIKKRLETATEKLKTSYYEDNRYTTSELKNLFDGKKIFDNPKSPRLLAYLIKFFPETAMVLDFFGGSGTTAHTVINLNKEDQGSRKFVLVQIPEITNEKSEAYKAGYRKISDITIERNKRVIRRIEKDESQKQPDLLNQNTPTFKTGFKVYKLAKSNFPRVDFAPDPDKTEDENLALLNKYIEDKEALFLALSDKNNIFDEVLLKNGFMLNYSKTKETAFTMNNVYRITDRFKECLICMDMTIEKQTLKELESYKESLFVCLERSLDTTMKWNLKHLLGDKMIAF